MIPAKPFYLIRHGQTEANAAHITAGGETDTPLTENGRQQARTVAACLHTLVVRPTRIIHSPMSRARDTATFINDALKLAIHEISDLREHLVGEWAGQPWPEVMPHLTRNIRPKGGENQDDFAGRIKKALTPILARHESPVMIVAHGGTFHSILRLYERSYSDHIENCHLHYFEPAPDCGDFPWRIWQFDIEEDVLVRRTAAFCGSLAKTTA